MKKYDVAVVAISNDEIGILQDPDVCFEVAKKIVERAADVGVSSDNIVVDPLVMPVGAVDTAGASVLHLIRRLREELKVINATCGASNFSFGLPNRHGLNASFLSMVIVAEGDVAKHGIMSSLASVSCISAAEEKYGSVKGLGQGRRISCNTKSLANVVIDAPPESRVHRQVVRKCAEAREITIDPAVRPYYVEIDKPDLHHPSKLPLSRRQQRKLRLAGR